jgi:DNA-directed RNA polymerase subunit RPC12/RpoP
MTTPYNMAFACLECCKSFKRILDNSRSEIPTELVCPNCGGISFNYGRHFKAPKSTDKKQWDKIRFLHKHGFRFQKIRVGIKNGNTVSYEHHDTVSYPETLEQAREFVIKYKAYALS